jgi:hypothetical protein
LSTAPKIDARQEPSWVLLAEVEMAPPQWARPLRLADVRSIAANFDPDKLASLAVWHRPDRPPSHGRYVLLDGQHRTAALRLLGYDDQRVPCLLYHDLTIERAAELSLGLQERRNLHAYDKHRAELAAHERRAVEIDKVLQALRLQFTYSAKEGSRDVVSAVSTVGQVWERVGGNGLERVLTVCGDAWERTAAGYSANILKLAMVLLAAHDGEIDDDRLAIALASRSPGQWLARNVTPRRPLTSIALDVIVEYNKTARGRSRILELTPSQYQQAAKRAPVATVRGKIDATAGAIESRGGRTRRPVPRPTMR